MNFSQSIQNKYISGVPCISTWWTNKSKFDFNKQCYVIEPGYWNNIVNKRVSKSVQKPNFTKQMTWNEFCSTIKTVANDDKCLEYKLKEEGPCFCFSDMKDGFRGTIAIRRVYGLTIEFEYNNTKLIDMIEKLKSMELCYLMAVKKIDNKPNSNTINQIYIPVVSSLYQSSSQQRALNCFYDWFCKVFGVKTINEKLKTPIDLCYPLKKTDNNFVMFFESNPNMEITKFNIWSWYKENYQEQYEELYPLRPVHWEHARKNKSVLLKASKAKRHTWVFEKEGKEIVINDLKQFCEENGLRKYSMYRIAGNCRENRTHYRGYKFLRKQNKKK